MSFGVENKNEREDDIMDIAALSMDLHMIDFQSKLGTAILSKSLDTLEDTGASMIKMMESSVMPNLGQNIDVSV